MTHPIKEGAPAAEATGADSTVKSGASRPRLLRCAPDLRCRPGKSGRKGNDIVGVTFALRQLNDNSGGLPMQTIAMSLEGLIEADTDGSISSRARQTVTTSSFLLHLNDTITMIRNLRTSRCLLSE